MFILSGVLNARYGSAFLFDTCGHVIIVVCLTKTLNVVP